MLTKTSAELTLFDRLSQLTFVRAVKLLGAKGSRLITEGGKYDIDITTQVKFDRNRFQLTLGGATVTLNLSPARRDRLEWRCDTCEVPCEHAGAAFSLILEEKLALGLASAPPERAAVEGVSEEALVAQAIAERKERARTEKMRLTSVDGKDIWADYTLTNAASGKSYRVALRGWEPGQSYCSCPDFRKNTLGTCKHILHALAKVWRRFPESERNRPYRQRDIGVHLSYGKDLELRLLVPARLDDSTNAIVRTIRDRPINDLQDLLKRIRRLEAQDVPVTVYPDAEEYIQTRLLQQRIAATVAAIRSNPKSHPLRKTLLKVEILPYQLDGIAFAAGAGRAILADDMGLGKTLQGIGVAELLAREADLRKVLVVCPASVKSQWRNEILRFSERDCQIVLGSAGERAAQYENGCFFTICNYEQVLRDILAIERAKWDLIILDEGQRIKNWEAKTTQTFKSLRSPFALARAGGRTARTALARGGSWRSPRCGGVRFPWGNDPATGTDEWGGEDGGRTQGASRRVSGTGRAGPTAAHCYVAKRDCTRESGTVVGHSARKKSNMTSKPTRIPDHLQAWITARKRHHLSHSHVQMARELGMNPKTLGKIDNADQEPWKLPLPTFIESLYHKRFGKDRPDVVHSIEERARLLEQKKSARREAKRLRREGSPQN